MVGTDLWGQLLARPNLKIWGQTSLIYKSYPKSLYPMFMIVYSTMDVGESQQLVNVIEDLVMAGAGGEAAGAAQLLTVVLNRLSARLRPAAEAVWGLYVVSETVTGGLKGCSVPCRQYCSTSPKDPLAAVPLQQVGIALLLLVNLKSALNLIMQV